MEKKIIPCLCSLFLFTYILGCTIPTGLGNDSDENIQLANPAAVYCQEQGYLYQIRDEPDGQRGYCIFGQVECDEWEFYRGECELGIQ
jgi:putative hemolysin